MRSLRAIHKFLLIFQRSGIKNSKFWLIVMAVCLGLGALSATHLKVLLSIDDLVDSDFKTYADLRRLNSSFSDKNDLFLVVASKNRSLNREELCAVQKWLIDDVDGQEPYSKVFSAFGVKKTFEKAGSWWTQNALDPQCEKLDPTVNVDSQLQDLKNSPWGAVLTSKDAKDIAISFYLHDGLQETRYGRFDVDAVKKVLESFEAKVGSQFKDIQAHFAGVALHQYYLKQGLDQTNILNLALPALALLLFWIFFGDIRPGILFVGTITVASIIVYGLMAAFGSPLDVLTNILTLMLVLSSLEDFLFIIHYNWNLQKPNSWRPPFRKLIMPGFFTSFTTAIGFAALGASDLAIIRRFGTYAAVASILEWALVFIFLPALLTRFPRFRTWLNPKPMSRTYIRTIFERATRMHLPRWICVGLLGFYLVSAVGVTRLHVKDAPASIFPKNHIITRDLDYIQESRGWESQVSLLFNDFGTDSATDEKNRAVLEELRYTPNVFAIESPYDAENYLTQSLSNDHANLVRSLWRDSPAAKRLIAKDGTSRALIYLEKTDTTSIKNLQDKVAELCTETQNCHLAGTLISYAEFGDRVLATLLESLWLSLLLVSSVIIYLLWARGHGDFVRILTSVLWGPVALVSVFWLFHFPVNFVTCTFASIVVGIAGDNTIQYLFACAPNSKLYSGVHKQGAASIQVCVMMMLLSLIFLASYFASVRSLTPLFVIGFLLILVGDLWIYKFLTKEN
jgi:predicted RND superfamily exporter protein